MERSAINGGVEECWVLRLGPDANSDSGLVLVPGPAETDLSLLVRGADAARRELGSAWRQGTLLVLMRSGNEVVSVVRVAGDPVAAPTTPPGGDAVRWPVDLDHRFDPPFHTIAHVGENAILSTKDDETARRVASEVAEARSPNGFTIDWSPLIGNY